MLINKQPTVLTDKQAAHSDPVVNADNCYTSKQQSEQRRQCVCCKHCADTQTQDKTDVVKQWLDLSGEAKEPNKANTLPLLRKQF